MRIAARLRAKSDSFANVDQHFTPYRTNNDKMDASSVGAREDAATASVSVSREAGRWAEAFQKNVLARQDATLAEPQPSQRPTPHGSTTTTTKTTTMTAATSTIVHSGNGSNHNPSRSPSPSAHTSPTPHSLPGVRSNEGGSEAAWTTPPCGMTPTSRTVAAVAVHPPLSRSSKRAAMAPAPTARFISSPTPSSASSHSTATTTTTTGAGATAGIPFASGHRHSLSSEPEGQSPRSLPPPPPLTALRQASNGDTAYSTASATATPNRNTPQPHNAAAVVPPQPSHIYTTPHARLNQTGNKTKAKTLSQSQLQSQRGGTNSSSSPVNSAGGPHIPSAYAASPFFQRVKDITFTTTATSPVERACDNGAAHPATQALEDTPHVSTREEAEDSALLQGVTPITNGGGSWRHDSQLRSQPRETMEASAAQAASGADYFSSLDHKLCGGDPYVDPSASLLPLPVSQLQPPPSMSMPLPSAVAVSQAMRVFTTTGSNSSSPHPADGGAVACSWDAAARSAFAPKASSLQQALYYPPGYAAESGAAPCMGFTSPFTPPGGDVSRLSASPGGLSGSHNATMNTTALHQSGMTSAIAMMPTPAMVMEVGSATMDGAGAAAAAASYLLQSSHPSNGSGGVSPYFHNGVPMGEAVHGGASPPGFASHAQQQRQRQSSYHSHTASPSPTCSAVMQRGSTCSPAGFGPVPTVSGTTTATTTAAIASGLSGVALERQLLHASKEELVQILLELGSCNPEASRFIDAKAFFFAFRHEHSRETTPAAAVDKPSGTLPMNTNSCSAESKGEGEEQPRRKSVSEGAVKALLAVTAGEGTKSGNRSIARCIFPAEAAEDDEADGEGDDSTNKVSGTGTHAIESLKPAGGSGGNLSWRRVRPEERPFCTDVHPCLRWYGACRNATSCAYASLPRNLCLNWVRGACVARAECSGVHRLPDPCPPELQRIYLLNHGLPRCDAGHALHALPVSPSPSPAVTPQTQPSWQHSHGGVGAPAAAAAAAAMHNSDGSALHTPCGQSIHKDAFMGGGSTPHRHHKQSPLEGADMKTGTRLIPRSAMDVLMDEDEAYAFTAAVSHMRELRLSGAASPTGSSSSTVEDKTRSGSVNRCLGHDFDNAVSPTCHTATGTVTAGFTTEENNSPVVSHPANAIQQACVDYRGSVLLPVCEAKTPLQVMPLRSVAAAVMREQEEEDYTDASAPAAGTRTRVQSPSLV
ncbi:glucoamylase-like protein [Leptomonas pyrrhocoris]|uniref:Glucoamylase-like protein n=1 Tax=Leptomonas pyrrhocoris TaxID=157538 RepID=A0A0M9G9M1_LEPPY|nr:glucoamylase-like protein [Leptomonas pyrrhocoris]KPA85670.1 glucoamylase-like protein [Leptomonas pyrrhocoris]|eukprot:XP_015664109.1 glucoamylase-like protein [Leptomonas pyrrhocoris]